MKKDIRGCQFGCLTAIEPVRLENQQWVWLFHCSNCGRVVEKQVKIVLRQAKKYPGKPQACGCLSRCREKHGKSSHPAYIAWRDMRDRCMNTKSNDWQHYGGRGLTICDRWKSVENFLEDMGETYRPGYSLDRIDNNKGYDKNNCRWTTRIQQNNNKRSNRYLTDGRTIAQAARDVGVNPCTLRHRLNRGWSEQDALEK